MQYPFYAGVGGVLSADIAVPEHATELEFYKKVLTTGTSPLWREDLSNNHGTPIIGLGERLPAYEALPLQWMPHFQVADVAMSAHRAVELGGTELMHGKADDGSSQWAVLVDPSGAAFGLIPVVVDAVEASTQASSGRIASLSLLVSDVPRISSFYEQVIGWTVDSSTKQGMHAMLRPDGKVAVAGIGPLNDDCGDVPSVWIVGLPVDDFEESLRQVQEGGGEVVIRSEDTGVAVIRDPVGVHFALQPNH